MNDTGSAGESHERVDDRVDRPDRVGSQSQGGWEPGPDRRGRRGLLFVAFAVVVIAIGSGVFKLATGDTSPGPIDPAHLAAPVTLPPSAPPTPTPPRPTGTQGVAAREVCPGSDGITADDQAGWQHGTSQDAQAPCGNRYSLHATNTDGGVFYRWMSDVGQPSHCDISVYIPDTAQANVPTVHYAVLDGDTLEESFVVAQAKDRGQFVSAGSYRTSGKAPLTVRMDSKSAVPGTVVASAVRFSCHPG